MSVSSIKAPKQTISGSNPPVLVHLLKTPRKQKGQFSQDTASKVTSGKKAPEKLRDNFISHLISLVDSAGLDGFYPALNHNEKNSPSLEKRGDHERQSDLQEKTRNTNGIHSYESLENERLITLSQKIRPDRNKGNHGQGNGVDIKSKKSKKEGKEKPISEKEIECVEQESGSLLLHKDTSWSADLKQPKASEEDFDIFNKTLLSLNNEKIDDLTKGYNEEDRQDKGLEQCKFKETLEKALGLDKLMNEEKIDEMTTNGNEDYTQDLNYHDFLKESFMDKGFGEILNSLSFKKESDPLMMLDGLGDWNREIKLQSQQNCWRLADRNNQQNTENIVVDRFFSRTSEVMEVEGFISHSKQEKEEEKVMEAIKVTPKEKQTKNQASSGRSLLQSYQMSSVLDFIFKKKSNNQKARNLDSSAKKTAKRLKGQAKRQKSEDSDEGSEWDESVALKSVKLTGSCTERKLRKRKDNERKYDNEEQHVEDSFNSNRPNKRKVFIIIKDKKPKQQNTRKIRLQSQDIQQDIEKLRGINQGSHKEFDQSSEESDDSYMEETVKKVRMDGFDDEELAEVRIHVEKTDFGDREIPRNKCFKRTGKRKDKDEEYRGESKKKAVPLRKALHSNHVAHQARPRRSAREKREPAANTEKDSDFTFVEFKQHKVQQLKVTVSLKALLMMNLHAHLSKLEVIGLLGGKVVSEEEIVIEEALTCRNIVECSNAHSVEMDPASQVETQEQLENMGYKNLGWYHSHPVFKTTPSQIDQETHLTHQMCYKDHAYIGMIIAPYFTGKPGLKNKGDVFVFNVVNNQTYKLNFSVKPISYLSNEDLQTMNKMVQEYRSSQKGIVLNGPWKKGLTYKEKITSCLSSLLEDNLMLLPEQQEKEVPIVLECPKDLKMDGPEESDMLDMKGVDHLDSTSMESVHEMNQENIHIFTKDNERIDLSSKQGIDRLLSFVEELFKEEASAETIL